MAKQYTLSRLLELAGVTGNRLTESPFTGAKVGEKVAFTGTDLHPPKTWEGTLKKIYPDGTVDIDFYGSNGQYQGPNQHEHEIVKATRGQGEYNSHWVKKI